MTIEEAVRAKLLTQVAVTALTSTIRVDQLDQTDTPEDEDTPCILITVDQETFEDQNIGGTTDLVTATMTISGISSDRAVARAVALAIAKNGTDPGTGLQGYATARNAALVWDSMLERRVAGYIPTPDGSDSGLYSVDSVFTVKYYETY